MFYKNSLFCFFFRVKRAGKERKVNINHLKLYWGLEGLGRGGSFWTENLGLGCLNIKKNTVIRKFSCDFYFADFLFPNY